jgi:glycine/D-amino acid oxidase-like deaminating enzyme
VLGAASRETEGAFVCGGFSGYGIMGACEAGRALAAAALDPSSPLLYPEFALGPERLSAPPRHHGGLGSQL